MIICGLDPSLTSAGIAILTDGTPTLLASVGHASQGKSFDHRSRRIVSQCRAIVKALPSQLDLVVIEEPAWGINMPSAHDRAGLWWGLYSALSTRAPIAVVNPKTRSKWATGRGDSSKLDVLAGQKRIKVCVGYRVEPQPGGSGIPDTRDELPIDPDEVARATPIYEELDGWSTELRQVREVEDLPPPARRYVRRIETLLGVDCYLISVGPGRGETIMLRNPFR